MASERLGHNLGIDEDLINKSCHSAIKAAHENPAQLFCLDKPCPDVSSIAFPGSWSLGDCYSGLEPANMAFGDSQVDLEMFPCLRSIGSNDVAKINRAFMDRFLVTKENTT